jgi:hypothetical protein
MEVHHVLEESSHHMNELAFLNRTVYQCYLRMLKKFS